MTEMLRCQCQVDFDNSKSIIHRPQFAKYSMRWCEFNRSFFQWFIQNNSTFQFPLSLDFFLFNTNNHGLSNATGLREICLFLRPVETYYKLIFLPTLLENTMRFLHLSWSKYFTVISLIYSIHKKCSISQTQCLLDGFIDSIYRQNLNACSNLSWSAWPTFAIQMNFWALEQGTLVPYSCFVYSICIHIKHQQSIKCFVNFFQGWLPLLRKLPWKHALFWSSTQEESLQ